MGKDSVTQDFATNVWRMKQLGFNAIRLPFRFTDFEVDPIPVKHECQVAPAVSHPSNSAQMLYYSIRTGPVQLVGSLLCVRYSLIAAVQSSLSLLHIVRCDEGVCTISPPLLNFLPAVQLRESPYWTFSIYRPALTAQ